MADRIAYLNRAPTAAPVVALSPIQTSHAHLIGRLMALRPHTIRYHADAADLEERAEHVKDVLLATLDYIGEVLADSADNCPIGLLQAADAMNIVADLSGDIAGRLVRAADELANGRA